MIIFSVNGLPEGKDVCSQLRAFVWPDRSVAGFVCPYK